MWCGGGAAKSTYLIIFIVVYLTSLVGPSCGHASSCRRCAKWMFECCTNTVHFFVEIVSTAIIIGRKISHFSRYGFHAQLFI